jgi:SAM-dependent methyltransferase
MIMSKLVLDKPASHIEPVSFDKSCQCPNCFSKGLTLFYSADNIPVHSTVQTASPEEAVNFPRGRLRLGFCSHCGFVSNTAYDATLQEYCSNCEESQGFSPTFNAFAKKLAQTWIDRYQIRNKTILEIGCGKGEFLVLMCELGNNRGIGIDPSYQPHRTPEEFKQRVQFIQDHYYEKYAHLTADVVLCRHTLEHIGRTGEFLRSIRRTIGNQLDTIVLFELPDVVRVLKEGAFWDIYYEHCSYFSPGSLARLFRQSGFDVVELERCYDDQYLLIGARPIAGEAPPPSLPLENDLDEMRDLVTGATARLNDGVAYWRNLILDLHAGGKKVVVWIALSKAVAFLTTLGVGDAVEFVVDINPFRQNKFMPGTGQRIVPPNFLAEYKPDVVILMNPIYRREVQADLDKIGLSNAKLLTVGT